MVARRLVGHYKESPNKGAGMAAEGTALPAEGAVLVNALGQFGPKVMATS